jgi:hypothetical protein
MAHDPVPLLFCLHFPVVVYPFLLSPIYYFQVRCTVRAPVIVYQYPALVVRQVCDKYNVSVFFIPMRIYVPTLRRLSRRRMAEEEMTR